MRPGTHAGMSKGLNSAKEKSPKNPKPQKQTKNPEKDKEFIMLEEYEPKQFDDCLNLDLDLPEKNSDIQPHGMSSETPLGNQELAQELEEAIQGMDVVLESKKKEYDTSYNKAETVSLMTKYQMIFVKIEVYLMNLASIFHSKTQPDAKIVFQKIKQHARERRENRARIALICVEKLKLNMSKLKHVVEKKKISKTSWAFYRIKNRAIETKLAEDMAKIRRTRVEQLKNLFEKKRQEYSQVKIKHEETMKKHETTDLHLAQESDEDIILQLQSKIASEKKISRQLRLDIRATEEKSLQFISEINQYLDMHQDFFNKNHQYAFILNEFLSSNHQKEFGET